MEDKKKKRIQLRLDELSDKDIINKISKIKANTHKPLATIVVAILRQSVPLIDENGNMHTFDSKLNNSIETDNKGMETSTTPFTKKETAENDLSKIDLKKILNKANFKEE